jgi:hypothetical protein
MGSTGSGREAEESPEGEAGRIISGGEGEREAGQSRSSLEDEDARRQRMLLQVLTSAASKMSAQPRSRSSGIGGSGGAGRYGTPMLSAQQDTPMPSPLMTSKHEAKSSVCLCDCLSVCLSVCVFAFTYVWWKEHVRRDCFRNRVNAETEAPVCFVHVDIEGAPFNAADGC